MSDDIRRLTELMARDPSSLAFLELAELLRTRGDLDAAYRVAIRGLERHTLNSEAHALLARICVDRGELQRAFDEWDMALRLTPGHAGALKGLGFISYRWGKLAEAEQYLKEALARTPTDATLTGALENVRRARASVSKFSPNNNGDATEEKTAPANSPVAASEQSVGVGASPSAISDQPSAISHQPSNISQPSAATYQPDVPPGNLFESVTGEAGLQALLVDQDGLVVAGRFTTAAGIERGQEIGAELSGLSDEANRAMRHLQLGEWKSLTFESPAAAVAMARVRGDSLVVVASDQNAPLGLLRRALERAQKMADSWLTGAR